MRLEEHKLRAFGNRVFEHLGYSKEEANICTDVLLSSDKRGIKSHGFARLPGYIRLINEKRINPSPQLSIVREKGGTATMDADGSIGLVSASKAMDLAIAKCQKHGSGWVAIQNSNHFGIAAYHAMKALPENMIGFALTNASPLVSIANGSDRILGTNPICVAIPSNKEIPFILDMATSAVSNGKVEIAKRAQENLKGDWVQNSQGSVTKSPLDMEKGGSLLPLGSTIENSHYKGYGLGAWVDIFCGVLSGANYGKFVPPFVSYLAPLASMPGKGIGHFVGAWDISGFRDISEFKNEMDEWIRHIKSSQAMPGKEILIPGEKEHYSQLKSEKEGIFLEPLVYEKLKDIDSQYQLNTRI
jgi:LDH2 family malate/lactate/ureidoglycolate dehydrogenase